MQNVIVQKAGEMPQPLRAAIEQMLGRPIAADEEISIVAVPPQQVAPSAGKAAAVRELEALLNRRATKVDDVPDEEINAAIDDAVFHARHNRE